MKYRSVSPIHTIMVKLFRKFWCGYYVNLLWVEDVVLCLLQCGIDVYVLKTKFASNYFNKSYNTFY